jgi:uncharacterized surface protein with fasciclin (FAS1) repeats
MKSLVLSLGLFALVACGGATPGPSDAAEAAGAPAAGEAAAAGDILAVAEGAGQFKTLLAAVKAAGLESTLQGAGPFTFFAPTDEAFAKLPAGTIDELLKPENKDKLASILTYHVVAGKVPSSDAVKLSSAKTVNGQELALSAASGSLKLDDSATVVKVDIVASNGVIHVIDTVVLSK